MCYLHCATVGGKPGKRPENCRTAESVSSIAPPLTKPQPESERHPYAPAFASPAAAPPAVDLPVGEHPDRDGQLNAQVGGATLSFVVELKDARGRK
jgi:hypothetical protein